MGFIFLFSIALSWFVFFIYNVKMFVGSTRLSSLKEAVYPALMSSFPQVFISLLFIAGGRYLFLIITANVPLFTVPMIFYSYVLFNALLF
jgi:hypothetical protein